MKGCVEDKELEPSNAGRSKHHKSPEDTAFVTSLKACAKLKDLHKGSILHADILKGGLLKKNIYIGNALISMYAKCSELAKAQQVFEELPCRDVVSWTALIAGYAQNGYGEKALELFEGMRCEGLSPNALTFACVLKACGIIAAPEKGKEIHAAIVKEGFLGKNSVLGTALIGMYAKCGALAKAQQVLDELPGQDIVSWTVLITGYCQHGHGEEALNCFERMQSRGFSPDAVTFACILKACGSVGAVEKGKKIHDEIVRMGLLRKDSVLGSALVDMYVKCGALAKAQQVLLDELSVRNVVTWTALIAGYAQHGHGEEALNCFKWMQHEGLSPNALTLACILKACGNIGAVEKGEELHAEIVRGGLLIKDIVLGSALVDMYAQCGALTKAQQVFDEFKVRGIVSWTALIAGYSQHGHGEEALNCFERMQCEGLSPDAVTTTCILKVCGGIAVVEKGKIMHAEIVREGWLGHDSVLGNALVYMYARCGALTKAQEVFDNLPVRDVVSWTALISGYAQHKHGEEALNSFERMQREGLSPNAMTFACILKACGSIGAAEKGKEIHAVIMREKLLVKDCVLGNALIDMYAQCGSVANAQQVFDELPVHNVVSWTALIAGYTQLGKYGTVFASFNQMVEEGIEPNLVTFTVVLNACSFSGLVDEGQMYFETMCRSKGIIPFLEHYTCMVDLFGCAGHFDKTMALIDKMPSSDYLSVWFALLGACRKWGNVKLGRLAFEHAVRLDEKCAVSYVYMRNIYTAAGMNDDADKIEAMRMKYTA